MSDAGTVLVMQGGMPVPVLASSLPVSLQVDVLAAALASANSSLVALTQRVAALEGKPDLCVALSGSLPVATFQIGTTDVSVAVPGLLSSDRIAVEVMAALPAGLVLGAVRPSPTANGILLVQAITSVMLSGKAAIPLGITALRHG